MVRPGFFMFMALVVFIQGWQFGMPFALFMAVFTLLHELGHAVAARRTGATAHIALDFMAGYAAFTPSRTLRRSERVLISFAGPAVQVLLGTAAYLLTRGALAWPEYGRPVQYAVLWAGPVIGLFNLLPVLPFDGGNIALALVEAVTPRHARRVMGIFSIAASGVAVAVMAVTPRLQPFMFFALIPLFAAAASMRVDQRSAARSNHKARLERCEALAWAADVVDFPNGTGPSPWYRAWQQLRAGHADIARQVLLDDFGTEPPFDWTMPTAAPLDALRQLVALLPRPLPHGRPYASYTLGEVLLRLGQYHDAGEAGAAAFTALRIPALAVQVARAAAALDDRATMLGWLRAARTAAPVGMSFDGTLDAPEFERFRHDPELASVLSA